MNAKSGTTRHQSQTIRAVIITGSARRDGGTAKLADSLQACTGWDRIDLLDYEISQYDYQHQNQKDDFLPLMRRILDNYELLVFITPVYWYAMSSILKVFFDRISDLLTIEKPLGRKMRGRKMAALSISEGGNLGRQFWLPFRHSAEYLGMDYLGNLHTYAPEPDESQVKRFAARLKRLAGA